MLRAELYAHAMRASQNRKEQRQQQSIVVGASKQSAVSFREAYEKVAARRTTQVASGMILLVMTIEIWIWGSSIFFFIWIWGSACQVVLKRRTGPSGDSRLTLTPNLLMPDG